jgi:replicative DNA helicase Mcm
MTAQHHPTYAKSAVVGFPNEGLETIYEALEEQNALTVQDDVIQVDLSRLENETYSHDFSTDPEALLGHISAENDGKLVEIIDTNEHVEEVELSEIGTEHDGKLVEFDAVVQELTDRKSSKIRIKFACKKGHSTSRRQQRWQKKTEKPTQCAEDGCGCQPYDPFDVKRIDTQQVVFSEAGEDDKSSTNIVGEIDEHHIGRLEQRDEATFYARVLLPNTDSVKEEPYLHILGFEREDDRVDLDDETIERVEEIADDHEDIIEHLSQSVAPHLVSKMGHDIARKAVLCSAVRACENETQKRETIHTKLYGLPGCGKSDILKYMQDVLPDSKYADASKSSETGLTASVVKVQHLSDDESWVLVAGTIPQADGSVAIIDELDKTDKQVKETLNEPLSNKKVEVSKVEEGTLSADVSVIAAGNPEDETYGTKSPYQCISLPDSTASRFDLVVRVDDVVKNLEKEIEIEREITRREQDGVDGVLSKEEMREYLAYARTLEPEMSQQAREFLSEKVARLRVELDDVSEVSVSGRDRDQLRRISEAMAKLRLGEKVTVADVERAWELITDNWSNLLPTELDLDSSMSLAAASKLENGDPEINKQVVGVLKAADKHNDEIPVEAVVEGTEASESAVEYILEALSKEDLIEFHSDSVEVVDL